MNHEKDISRAERELLTLIRSRPAVYLGDYAGLHEFQQFVHGYEVAARRHDLHDVRLIPEGFQEFIEERFGLDESCVGWWRIIAETEPDNRAALGYFWLLLNEYLFSCGLAIIPPPRTMPEQPRKEDGLSGIGFTDLSRLAESYMRTFNGEPWWDRWDKATALARLKDLYRSPGFDGTSVWKDGMPVGAVMGRVERYCDGDCFQIVEFWVEPRVQKEGWDVRMLDDLRERLRFQGVRKIFLVTVQTPQIGEFYTKNGFVLQDGMCVMQIPE